MKYVVISLGFIAGCTLITSCSNSNSKSGSAVENSADLCGDGIDNDSDGAPDCADAECAGFCTGDAGDGGEGDGGDTDSEVATGDVWHNKEGRGEVMDPGQYVVNEPTAEGIGIVASGKALPLVVSSADYPGVVRVVGDLAADIERVTAIRPVIVQDAVPASTAEVVIVGTIEKSPIIDGLVQAGKLDVTGIAGKWETFLTQVIEAPMAGVTRALVIAGSDKRGTIYGAYDLSAQIGVSPWYFWADVPTRNQSALYVTAGRHSQGEPDVKYRGIFINHEGPCLSSWADDNYGGFKGEFYKLVFELILRMKGNYLWPAMWGRAFYDDDPQNAVLADEYGIVMGTSHHEPMMRAQDEWARYGSGDWDYETNAEVLKEFWRSGVERVGYGEATVTMGMRGDGDYAMTAQANIGLLETIITDQRQILAEVTGRDPSDIPQVWTLYKEVQDYYDMGMEVPDDVTIIFSDDNWGNIRKLPNIQGEGRGGGHGIYYHFEYLGSPRGYRWVNSSPLPRVWEQMDMAYRYGADRLWIVNIGDIKPLELPIQFFLDFAWDPDRWTVDRINEYTQLWAEQQFGPEYAAQIGEILGKYTKYNARRKIELLEPSTYSQVNYHEAETVVNDYNQLADQAQQIYDSISDEYKDAYYELVLYPVKASAVVNDMYESAAKNDLYAQQGRAATNAQATRVRELFAQDDEMSYYFNHTLAGGKWNDMADQVHIGYTSWEAPSENIMPEVTEIVLPEAAELGVAIEGSTSWWPQTTEEAVLPEFTPYFTPTQYIEVFNRGQTPFDYTVTSDVPYLTVTPATGTVSDEQRLSFTIDWAQAPLGTTQVPITVSGANSSVVIQAIINNPTSPRPGETIGFIERNGYVSIEADQYTATVGTDTITWQRIPDLGRTSSAMKAFPSTSPAQTPGGDCPRLEYRMQLFSSGEVNVRTYVSPTLNFMGPGLRYAISFDEETPQIVDIHGDYGDNTWQQWVKDNIITDQTTHTLTAPGDHVLKFWMVDPGVVLEKIVIDFGGEASSYLGPPSALP